MSADPVADLIARADSLARAGDVEGIARLARAREILIGAAVGQLLEAAIEAGDAGDRDSERETVLLAEKLATIHAEQAGSIAPLGLVRTHQQWTSKERSARARTKAVEADAAAARDAGELDLAARKILEAIEGYRLIGDDRSIAVIWGSLGVVHWARGDWDLVRDSYLRALDARRAVEDRILEGKTLNGLGSVHFQTGDFETAVRYYRMAASLRRKTGDDAGLVQTLNYLSATLDRMGRLAEAAETLDEALGSPAVAGEPIRRIETLNVLGSIHSKMGRLKSAENAFREATDLARAIGEAGFEAICRLNLADLLGAKGRYRESMAELDRVRGLLDHVGDASTSYSLYRNRGLLFLEMGELEQARDDLLMSLRLAEEADAPGPRIEALINLACLFVELDAADEGLQYAERASELAEAAGDLPMLRAAAFKEADLHEARGSHEKALALYRRAAELDMTMGNRQNGIEDEISICNSIAASGALEEARRGFYAVRPAVDELGLRCYEHVIHFGIGHTFEGADRDSAAWHYERALECLERERASIGGGGIRSGFLSGDKRRLYEEVCIYYAALARASGDASWAERAFRTMERGKARGLLDLLETRIAADCSPAEEEIIEDRCRLDPAAPDYRERILLLENQYARLRDARIEKELGELSRGAGISSIADLGARLAPGEVAFAYALGDTASLLWVIDSNGCDLHWLPSRPDIDREVMRMREALTKPGRRDEVLVSASRRLYGMLIEPGASKLEGASSIVVVPDGSLFELPFEALLAGEAAAGAAWRDMPFLARSLATLYAPSGTIFCRLHDAGGSKSYEKQLLAVGDPEYSALGRAPGRGEELENLPHSRTEIESICARFEPGQADMLCGSEASERGLKTYLKKCRPRIVHIAAHGIVDRTDPAASCIALSPDALGAEDGYLRTLEILGTPFEAALVVLSACESALGRVSRGEGVLGLGRAFIGAGAGGVVASLWAVSDRSTAELMSVFYDRMIDGRRPAARALADARLAMLRSPDYSHPFYWSPFVMVGTDRTPW